MPWNPETYNKFKKERNLPFYDLLALIAVKPRLTVLDLGCGTGELTRMLADALPDASVTGIDASAEMLRESVQFERAGLRFYLQSIEETLQSDEQYDLIFSNAAIQWVNDHPVLLPQIIARIRAGGQLAIQLPSNHHSFTHTGIRELAAREPYVTALNGWNRESPVLPPETYAEILFNNGGGNIRVFEKVYPHVLPDAAALVEWTSGTALVPYMERLPDHLQQQFRLEYAKMIAAQTRSVPVFYPFKRTLMAAEF